MVIVLPGMKLEENTDINYFAKL